MQSDNANDEANGQDENDDGIDLEAGRLVGVEPFEVVSLSIILFPFVRPLRQQSALVACHSGILLIDASKKAHRQTLERLKIYKGVRTQHGAAATASAGGAGAARASIGGLVSAVGGSLPPDGHSRATRGLGRRGTGSGGAGRRRRVDGGAGARGRLREVEGQLDAQAKGDL